MDEDNSGEIEFSEFCRVIEKHKEASASNSDEQDTLDAFVALGGNVSRPHAGLFQLSKLCLSFSLPMCRPAMTQLELACRELQHLV